MVQQLFAEQVISTVRLSTGVTLSYLEQGDPAGEPVIMLHGFTNSSLSFSRVLPLFSPDYHIFALDMRGHGHSSKSASSFEMSDYVADVIAFMDAKGIKKATLTGHSLGSMVAQLATIQYPERVSRLVLVGSMTRVTNDGVKDLNKAVQTLEDPVDPEFAREFQSGKLFRNLPADFLDAVVAESLKVPARVWREAFASFVQQDTTEEVAKIRVPTLIIWGDHDPNFSYRDQETLRDRIPNSRLLIYKLTGHSPHWEQPELFVADLEQFLQLTWEIVDRAAFHLAR